MHGDASESALIDRIEVALRSEVIPDRVVIVDSPGAGSLDPSHGARAIGLLERAHAAVFVVGFDAPESEGLVRLLTQFQQRIGRIGQIPAVVALNKIDLAKDAAQREETMARVRDLARDCGLNTQPRAVAAQAVLYELTGQGASDPSDVDRHLAGFVSFRRGVERLLVEAEETESQRRELDKTRDRFTKVEGATMARLRFLQKSRREKHRTLALIARTRANVHILERALLWEHRAISLSDTGALLVVIRDALREELKAMGKPHSALRPHDLTYLAGGGADAARAWLSTRAREEWNELVSAHRSTVRATLAALEDCVRPLQQVGLDLLPEHVEITPPAWSEVEFEVVPTLGQVEAVIDEVLSQARAARVLMTWLSLARSRLLSDLAPHLTQAVSELAGERASSHSSALDTWRAALQAGYATSLKTLLERIDKVERASRVEEEQAQEQVGALKQALMDFADIERPEWLSG